jgi:hypothetical protein
MHMQKRRHYDNTMLEHMARLGRSGDRLDGFFKSSCHSAPGCLARPSQSF